MKTLKKIIVSILFIGIAFISYAQDGETKNREAIKEKMAAVKVGYLTEKLDLTEDEAAKFWPVYKQEKNELEMLRMDKKEQMKPEEMSDEQLEKQIYENFDKQQKRLNIQQAYVQKYIAIIGVQKTAKLYKAEHDFKKEMLSKLQKGQGQQVPPKK